MRKFICPFCTFTKNFFGEESKYKKRVTGITCPRCGKKVRDADIAKKKGKGPKPPGERRKRSKKRTKETPSILAPQPYVQQIVWHTRGPQPPGDRDRHGIWQPKSTTRTMEEIIVVDQLSNMAREASESAAKKK